MKNSLSVILVTMSFFLGGAEQVCAEEEFFINDTIYLDVFEQGKMTGHKIIADPIMTSFDGRLGVSWRHIYITPFDDQKDVNLKIETWSSDEGNIRDIRLNPDHTVTFQIKLVALFDPQSERNINVFLKLSDDNKRIEDVHATLAFWSNITNSKEVKEWKMSKQSKFKLPYQAVF